MRVRHDILHLTRTLNIYFQYDLFAKSDMFIDVFLERSIVLSVYERMLDKSTISQDTLEFLF